MLKAAAGGGGKGMRVVRRDEEMDGALRAARSEAASSFGDDGVYAEKYLEAVRHVEVQILVDGRGEGVHLGERECSVQRRHQKLIEEAPSVALDAAARERIGALALEVARAAGYRNAGTVEFLLDDAGNPYFMEVNARIQVEHPVTEMVTGHDLVRAQILIAAGEPLPMRQDRLRPRGWAIECRVLAEDPVSGFLPCPGRITDVRLPAGPGIRVDTALRPGDEVSLHYDALIAKVIAWGRDRHEAIRRMRRALDECVVGGIRTTVPLSREILADPEFQDGRIDIAYLDRRLPHLLERLREPGPDALVAAAAAAAFACEQDAARRPAAPEAALSPWTAAGRRALHETRARGRA
jgi:acetyl-CoA carboxylase biotin carboxylase subunit